MNWFGRLFGRLKGADAARPPAAKAAAASHAPGAAPPRSPAGVPPRSPAAAPPREPAAAPAPEAAAPPPPSAKSPLACWLFDAALAENGPSGEEVRALAVLDAVLQQPRLPPELLPRAAKVVPQLVAMLRHDDLPTTAMAEQFAKDPPVAAELLRMASSAYFRSLGPVDDLRQAITRLGIDGVRIAIARVVLVPVYQAEAGTLAAEVLPRVREHADLQSELASAGAAAAGVGTFDAYLAGLLYDTGWTVLCHALMHAKVSPGPRISAVATLALEARAHALFGLAAEPWGITPAFQAFATEARHLPLERSQLALARLLREAQAAALSELNPAP